MSRFETEVLTQDGNVEGLGRLNAEWVDGAMSRTPHRRVILDMDSSESRYMENRREHRTTVTLGARYHPVRVPFGLRGRDLRATCIARTSGGRCWTDPFAVRGEGSAAILSGRCRIRIYEYLEERRVFYAIRLPSNKVLQYEIAPLLIRPGGGRRSVR